jgi:hypothetical protein
VNNSALVRSAMKLTKKKNTKEKKKYLHPINYEDWFSRVVVWGFLFATT